MVGRGNVQLVRGRLVQCSMGYLCSQGFPKNDYTLVTFLSRYTHPLIDVRAWHTDPPGNGHLTLKEKRINLARIIIANLPFNRLAYAAEMTVLELVGRRWIPTIWSYTSSFSYLIVDLLSPSSSVTLPILDGGTWAKAFGKGSAGNCPKWSV